MLVYRIFEVKGLSLGGGFDELIEVSFVEISKPQVHHTVKIPPTKRDVVKALFDKEFCTIDEMLMMNE